MDSWMKCVLVSCVAGMPLAAAANGPSMAELQAEYARVLETCRADAGARQGYDRDKFILACRVEKTSVEAKIASCTSQMHDAISPKAQRDPVLRKEYIDDCVQHWTPRGK
jgi:hypothetical protein